MGRRRTEQERRREVAGWQASGQSAGAYARARGYSPTSLQRWRDASAEAEPGAPAFVRLDVIGGRRGSLSLEVGGARIVVEAGFDPALLRSVVDALVGGGTT